MRRALVVLDNMSPSLQHEYVALMSRTQHSPELGGPGVSRAQALAQLLRSSKDASELTRGSESERRGLEYRRAIELRHRHLSVSNSNYQCQLHN